MPIGAGPELGVAATKTYLASIMVIAMLSGALLGDDASQAELGALPAAIRAALGTEAQIERLAAERADDDRCVVLARGFQYATAREWALKVKEMAYVLADPYSAADFQHGPIALVQAGFPVLAVATAGPAMPGMLELLGRLQTAGARLLVLSDNPAALALGDGVELPGKRARVARPAGRDHPGPAVRLAPRPGPRRGPRPPAQPLEGHADPVTTGRGRGRTRRQAPGS